MNRGRHATILIVDDDDGHIELVRRNLERAGLTNPVVALHSGEEALDYLFFRGPYAGRVDGEHLVLLDINMPGRFDGREVLREVKGDPRTRLIPVVMLTTTDDPREVDRCYGLGCNFYVTKPVAPNAFGEVIRRLGMLLDIVELPQGHTPPSP